MAINYKLTLVNDNITNNPKPRYKVTILPSKNVNLKQIKKILEMSSSATKGDISLVLDNFFDLVADLVIEGHTVSADALGTFGPIPGVTQELNNPNYVPAGAICLKGVSFRPSTAFREKLKQATFRRVK